MNRVRSAEPEHHLLKLVAGGDRNAFRELYDMTARRIYFYLYRLLQDASLAEDVQMDVYVEVWKGAGKFRGQSKVTTWMFGIARNLALKTLRKQRNHANIDDFVSLEDPDQPDLEAPDRQRIVKQAMNMISAKHREVLDFVFFQQMRYQEIASILDVSVNTVKTRVYYAKAALLKTMEELGVTKDDL
jgi:RNA polymerase sigma-70 factor (ECF subfamily)